MWKVYLRIKERLSILGIWASIFAPGIGFILTGFCMVGYIFIALSLLLLLYVLLRPINNEIPPMEYSIKNSKEVWWLWFTGKRHLDRGLLCKDSIKKILVLNPNSDSFIKNVGFREGDWERSRSDIIAITKEAKSKGISIKWYSEFQKISFTLYEPKGKGQVFSNKAYSVREMLELGIPPDSRRKYISLNKGNGQIDFQDRVDSFNRIWDDKSTIEPSERDYGKQL